MSASDEIDARGLKCPLPVLKAEKALDQLAPGGTLRVIADDPIARIDIPLMCRKAGHECTVEEITDALSFTITKKVSN